MLRLGKVAVPFTALSVAVPDRVPPPGFVPMATVMEFVAVVTTVPWASSTLTWTDGVMVAPTAVFVGWVVNPSFAGGPAWAAVRLRWKAVPPSPRTEVIIK